MNQEPISTILTEWKTGQLDAPQAMEKLFAHYSSNPVRPAPQVHLDDAIEALRKVFVKLPRYSFLLAPHGTVRRVLDRGGNWVEFSVAHTLFDPVAVDAAIAKHGVNAQADRSNRLAMDGSCEWNDG